MFFCCGCCCDDRLFEWEKFCSMLSNFCTAIILLCLFLPCYIFSSCNVGINSFRSVELDVSWYARYWLFLYHQLSFVFVICAKFAFDPENRHAFYLWKWLLIISITLNSSDMLKTRWSSVTFCVTKYANTKTTLYYALSEFINENRKYLRIVQSVHNLST